VLELTLILHSTWRWAVIFTLAVVLLDGLLALSGHPPDRAASRKRFKLLVVAMDVQFLVGILVYAQSPLVRLAWQNLGNTMKNRELRIFVLEHPVLMTAALVLTHLTQMVARRAPGPRGEQVRTLGMVTLIAGLVALALPWTRPLLRLG